MNTQVKSKLSFLSYSVQKVVFNSNKNFKNTGQPIDIDFNIKNKTTIKNDRMDIELLVKVFEKMEENNYPFNIQVDIIGNFKIQGEDIKNFEINAIAILYPYVRAIISTYTANSNIPTLILPPINVNKLLEKQNKKDKNILNKN